MITFTCPEPSPLFNCPSTFSAGVKGGGDRKGGGTPRVTPVAPSQRSLTIHPFGITDETNRKKKLL